jgi:ABC-type uncharacterized transport system ATPase subunit
MESTFEAQKSISTDYAIVVKGLRKSFKKLTVLDGVDFSVKRGTVLALLGPNGAGKTTTIRIVVRCFYRTAVRHCTALWALSD